MGDPISEQKTNESQTSVLIAEDDKVTRRILKHHLEAAGYRIIEAKDGEQAQQLMHEDISIALLDLLMPHASGLDCLKHIKANFPNTQVLMLSGRGEISDAVSAMKQGASEYLTKPFVTEEVLAHVHQAAQNAKLARDNSNLRQIVSGPYRKMPFVAHSKVAQKLLEQIQRTSELDGTLLITGPSGTGKTTIARMIHQNSHRANHDFISVSCAALPRDLIEDELFGHEKGAFTGAGAARPGRAEIANQGSLFLDEIGDLPRDLQPKLLTFLQDQSFQRIGGNKTYHVDVRMIAATHQNLEEMCQDGSFRQDLFYRLDSLRIEVPALKDRKEDIPDLSEPHFSSHRFSKKLSTDSD